MKVDLSAKGNSGEIGMNGKAMIKRKVHLKDQALRLIRTERDGLRHQLNLLSMRDFFQSQAGKVFDSELSAQLDAVQFLIDSLGAHFQTSGVFDGQN